MLREKISLSSRTLRCWAKNLALVSNPEMLRKKSRSRLELWDLKKKILVLVSNLEIESDFFWKVKGQHFFSPQSELGDFLFLQEVSKWLLWCVSKGLLWRVSKGVLLSYCDQQYKINIHIVPDLEQQARKARRCDSYLQIWNYHPLTDPLTDWLTGVGARRCYCI